MKYNIRKLLYKLVDRPLQCQLIMCGILLWNVLTINIYQLPDDRSYKFIHNSFTHVDFQHQIYKYSLDDVWTIEYISLITSYTR